MDWIVVRKLALLSREDRIERINSIRSGKDIISLTFSRIVKIGAAGNWSFEMGDCIYWAVKEEEGVFAKVEVIEKECFKIYKKEELCRMRETKVEESLKNDEKYWEKEYNKIENLREQYLSYCLLKTKTVEVFEPFPLRASPQPGFRRMTPEDFALRNMKCPLRFKLGEDYEAYDDVCKARIDRVFDGRALCKRPDGSWYLRNTVNFDYDHNVPKKIGGPGKIFHNLIPMSSSLNRSKSDKISISLIHVAKKYLPFPLLKPSGEAWQIFHSWEEAVEKWYGNDSCYLELEKQHLAVYITNFMREQPEEIQSRFYYEVAIEEYGKLIEDLYIASRNKPENKSYYNDIYRVLDTRIKVNDGKLYCCK